MKLIGFTNQDVNDLTGNDEFEKAIRPSKISARRYKVGSVREKDVFTVLGELYGLIYWGYNEDDIVLLKTGKTYLGEKKGKLHFLYPKKKPVGNIGNIRNQTEKYIEFHWGLEPKEVLSLDYPKPDDYLNFQGTLTGIMYRTEKNGDGGKVIYVHAFDKPFPVLFKLRNKYYIAGGRYTIQEKGIVH